MEKLPHFVGICAGFHWALGGLHQLRITTSVMAAEATDMKIMV